MAYPTVAQDKAMTADFQADHPSAKLVPFSGDSAQNVIFGIRVNNAGTGETSPALPSGYSGGMLVVRQPVAAADYANAPIGTLFLELTANTTPVASNPVGADLWIKGTNGIVNLMGLNRNIVDPGASGAIPVTASGTVQLVTAAAETRTLAAPAFLGQEILLCLKTDGGDCVVTCATTVNQTGNNTITFNDAGDSVRLHATQNGANLRWKVVCNDTAALTTV